jgi:protein phosphatase
MGELVVLIGAPASGKSTYASSVYGDVPTRILSSDRCRALVSDDEERMDVSKVAFEFLYALLDARLSLGHDTLVDSTAINPAARKRLLDIARKHGTPFRIAVVFNPPLEVLLYRNAHRSRRVPEDVIKRMYFELQAVKEEDLYNEGFTTVNMNGYVR